MQYLEITTEEDTFDISPTPLSTITLRIVPDEVEKDLRQKATGKAKWERHQRVQGDFDVHEFLALVLDYAIVSWSGVRARGVELPCDRKHKLLLPEALKSEINRLCLGKAGAAEVADQEKKDLKPTSRG